jgi:hypothetical protein
MTKPYDRYAPIELPPDDEEIKVIPITDWPAPDVNCPGCGSPRGEAHYYDCLEAVLEPEDVIRKRILQAYKDQNAIPFVKGKIPAMDEVFEVTDEDVVP